MALVDPGCMLSLARRQCCQEWKQKETCVLMVGGSTLKSCGVGVVELSVGTMLPIAVEVSIVDGELLGFDLLLGLDAVLRGMNLVLQWKAKTIHLWTDSACVHHWVLDTLSGQTRVCTKATSKMLIRNGLPHWENWPQNMSWISMWG